MLNMAYLTDNALTSNRADCATPSMVINDGGVAFDNAVHCKVAAIPCVRYFSVLECLDRRFHGIYSRAAILHNQHS